MQEYALALPFGRDGETTLIPDAGNEVGVFNTRKFTFRTEGNDYLAVEARRSGPAPLFASARKVEGVCPCAVDVLPLGSFKLRSGVLGTWLGNTKGRETPKHHPNTSPEGVEHNVLQFVCIFHKA